MTDNLILASLLVGIFTVVCIVYLGLLTTALIFLLMVVAGGALYILCRIIASVAERHHWRA